MLSLVFLNVEFTFTVTARRIYFKKPWFISVMWNLIFCVCSVFRLQCEREKTENHRSCQLFTRLFFHLIDTHTTAHYEHTHPLTLLYVHKIVNSITLVSETRMPIVCYRLSGKHYEISCLAFCTP